MSLFEFVVVWWCLFFLCGDTIVLAIIVIGDALFAAIAGKERDDERVQD